MSLGFGKEHPLAPRGVTSYKNKTDKSRKRNKSSKVEENISKRERKNSTETISLQSSHSVFEKAHKSNFSMTDDKFTVKLIRAFCNKRSGKQL